MKESFDNVANKNTQKIAVVVEEGVYNKTNQTSDYFTDFPTSVQIFRVRAKKAQFSEEKQKKVNDKYIEIRTKIRSLQSHMPSVASIILENWKQQGSNKKKLEKIFEINAMRHIHAQKNSDVPVNREEKRNIDKDTLEKHEEIIRIELVSSLSQIETLLKSYYDDNNQTQSEDIRAQLSEVLAELLLTRTVQDQISNHVLNIHNMQEVGNANADRTDKKITENLVSLYSQNNKIKQSIIEGNLPFIHHIASPYKDIMGSLEFIDLLQYGWIGMNQAINKHSPETGYKFISYAKDWVKRDIRNAIAEHGRSDIRISPKDQDRFNLIHKHSSEFFREKGRNATLTEIARSCGMTKEEVSGYMQQQRGAISMDAPLEGSTTTFGERLHSNLDERPEDHAMEESAHDYIGDILDNTLTSDEYSVLRKLFGLETGIEKTIEEIASELGKTRNRIKEIKDKAIIKLRRPEIKTALLEGQELDFV